MSLLISENSPWFKYIPLLHRIMADKSLCNQFPRVHDQMDLYEACAVWEALHYLLKAILGWNDPGQGLLWWYANGKQVDDSPILALVSEIWDQDQQLDHYAAWTWSYQRESRLAPNTEWWRNYESNSRLQGYNPYQGGYNPLHLGYSDLCGCDDITPDQSLLHYDQKTFKAVLVVNQLGSWRHDLNQATARLPEIGDRSWHVEVFDRQTGFLGKYRRSRVTDIWFQEKHSLHMSGQSEQLTQLEGLSQ